MGRLVPSRVVCAAAFLSTMGAAASLDALAAAGAPSVAAPAHEHQHAHVHGVARLGIAVQDKTLTIQLESPLDTPYRPPHS
jgi:hypothetical protein